MLKSSSTVLTFERLPVKLTIIGSSGGSLQPSKQTLGGSYSLSDKLNRAGYTRPDLLLSKIKNMDKNKLALPQLMQKACQHWKRLLLSVAYEISITMMI